MKSLVYKILFLLFFIKLGSAIPQPGEKYFIDINDLAKPYATKSVANTYQKLDVDSCKLDTLDGFEINIFAKNLNNPRNIKVELITIKERGIAKFLFIKLIKAYSPAPSKTERSRYNKRS